MRKHPEQLINEQVQRWRLRQAMEESASKWSGKASEWWPIITISREFAAHGDALAKVLSERTGFAVWDKKLVQAIADVGGSDVRVVQTLDERHQRVIEDAVRGALNAQCTNYHYLQSLLRVVHTVAAHGGVIVIGRGAHYICEPHKALRVRVVSPREERVRCYAAREGLSMREARRIVDQRETDQASFIRSAFKRDVTDPADYDLVLNAATYGVEGLADVVMAAYESKVGRRPKRAASVARSC